MPIINFLELCVAPWIREPIALRRGDLVFHLSLELANVGLERWAVREYCHAGILARDYLDHWLGMPVAVLHMGSHRINRDLWCDGDESRVDVVGVVNGLDRTSRRRLIQRAMDYFGRTLLPIGRSSYFMAEGLPCCNPNFPGDNQAFGFTCSTFVHQCFEEIGLPIVQIDQMPMTTESELTELVLMFGSRHTASQPFRRLYPSYMIGATETDQIPFNPADWDKWKDHGRYVPEHARVK